MITSLRRAARLVESHVEVYGTIAEDDVKRELLAQGVADDVADDAIRFGLLRGRFVRRTENGESVLRWPRVDTPRFNPRVGWRRR